MNLYSQLQKMEIGNAVNKMAELILPRFTKEKVLTVSLYFSVRDYRKHKTSITETYKEIVFVFYRPNNYMFVGLMSAYPISEKSEIEFLSYHDSCWTDAVDRKIISIAEEISQKYEGIEGLSVSNSFKAFGTGLEDGYIKTDSVKRLASFIALPQKEQI